VVPELLVSSLLRPKPQRGFTDSVPGGGLLAFPTRPLRPLWSTGSLSSRFPDPRRPASPRGPTFAGRPRSPRTLRFYLEGVSLLARSKLAGRRTGGCPYPSDPLGLLSWGSQRSPLRRHKPCASTPTEPLRTQLRLKDRHVLLPVPSSPFLPASTVSSAQNPAGLLQPAAGHGVRHVSAPLQTLARVAAHKNLPAVPPLWRPALRSFPLDASRTASPRPLPSHRFGSPLLPRPCALLHTTASHPRANRSQGLAPASSPLRAPGVAARPLLVAPMGFVSLQVRVSALRPKSESTRRSLPCTRGLLPFAAPKRIRGGNS
jgi:hypothetical protein